MSENQTRWCRRACRARRAARPQRPHTASNTRPSPCASSCRSRPAAAATSPRACFRTSSPKFWDSSSSSDNRGGAGGLIGMEVTARAAPDGYTIMMMSGSFSATSAVQKPAFDPINSIVAVAEFGYTPFVADDTSIAAGEDDQGADRARAHDERRPELCRDRHRRRHAPCHRAFLAHGEDQDGRHPVQEHRRGDVRSPVGPGAGDRRAACCRSRRISPPAGCARSR